MDREITIKRIARLLQFVNDCDLDNLLWVVQKFAAEGMNRKNA